MSQRGAENIVNHTPPHSLVRWDSDAIAGWEREAPAPADDPQARIVLVGPETAARGAVEAIPTWQADTPPGSWVELQLRARFGDRWSRFNRVAAWDGALRSSRRSSFSRACTGFCATATS